MNPTREEALFALALSKPAAKRAAWLDAECEGDAALRARLEAWRAAHEKSSGFLPAEGDPSTVISTQVESARPIVEPDFADASDEAIGTSIGRYKLLERVGEGGCGAVYVAEQTEPVRRRVALKVVKLDKEMKRVLSPLSQEQPVCVASQLSGVFSIVGHPLLGLLFVQTRVPA